MDDAVKKSTKTRIWMYTFQASSHHFLSCSPIWNVTTASSVFQQSLVPAEVTPAGCCCGDVWWPSDSPQRGWRAPRLPCARSYGSSGPPPAGRSTGAAWKTTAPPETHEVRTSNTGGNQICMKQPQMTEMKKSFWWHIEMSWFLI